MEQQLTEIPIFFSIDDGYAPWLSVAMQSMIANASPKYRYKIFVLHQGLQAGTKDKLASLAGEQFAVEFIYLEKELAAITDRTENRLRCDYFTLTIYFRLFIPDMFPQYDKGIYLDSDIVVPGDIAKLYQVELGDHLFGACRDHSIMGVEELVYYITEAIGVKKEEYVNSGVLLMNLKMMRQQALATRFLELMHDYHFDCIAPDQDYLNAMASGRIVYLDACWDAMPTEGEKPMVGPQLIHYNLFSKPWCYDGVAYAEYFWQYAKESPFYQEIVAFKQHYSEEQKRSDDRCLRTLLAKGKSIPQAEITFKKVAARGERVRL